jgi:hypothetical protein
MSESRRSPSSLSSREEWDKTPMAYSEVPPTDEDGNPEGATSAKQR